MSLIFSKIGFFQNLVKELFIVKIHRTRFDLDENGIIEDVISDVKTKAHAAQFLK